jgi:hypothetical protein
MSGPSHRGFRRSVAVLACLISVAAALLTGSNAAGDVTQSLRVLQMNLCDSGLAGCYTGRAVVKAAAVIRAQVPDVVTLNEVCQDDVDVLGRALQDVHRGDTVVWAFKAAGDRRSSGDFFCRNGQPYGIGLVARIPAPQHRYITFSGLYPAQDTNDPEERAWLCIQAARSYYACTTHLANTSPAVALAQCAHLLGVEIPAMRTQGGYAATVLGGDLNLSHGGSTDVGSCVPPGYLRRDDEGVQQVMATTDLVVSSLALIGMDDTTDHPSLLVALTIAGVR